MRLKVHVRGLLISDETSSLYPTFPPSAIHYISHDLSIADAEEKSRKPMTLQEACQRLGKSETTLRRWIKTGKLKAELALGKYEIFPHEVERLADDYAMIEDAQSVEADLLVEEMTRQVARQEKEIEFLRRELSEQSKRHDMIVMQLSQQLSRAYFQLEDQRHRKPKPSVWRRVFRWT